MANTDRARYVPLALIAREFGLQLSENLPKLLASRLLVSLSQDRYYWLRLQPFAAIWLIIETMNSTKLRTHQYLSRQAP